MDKEDPGEYSQDSDDSDSSRPLKKAKFVWQVKGKYHLKPNPEKNLESEGHSSQSSCDSQRSPTFECHCMYRMPAKTELLLDSDDDDEIMSRNIDTSISNEIPVTLVAQDLRNQDYFLRKWQARQIARGYIDNTINTVLEVGLTARFDADDLVDNADDDIQVEDEGIMMAIQAHGLQSNKKVALTPLALIKPEELAESTLDKIDTVRTEYIREEFGDNYPASTCSADDRDMEAQVDLDPVYPVDVLNHAIMVAIEKKGLSSPPEYHNNDSDDDDD